MRQPSSVSNHHRARFAHTPFDGSTVSRYFSARTLQTAVLLLGVPALLLLDGLYFSIARPSCAACGSFGDFVKTSSLTVGYLASTPHLAAALALIRKL